MDSMVVDDSQRASIAACLANPHVSIIGGPGTGKTTVLAQLVCERAGSGKPVVFITQDRRAARVVRESISRELAGIPSHVRIQTLTAFAFEIVQAYAQAVGRENPELIAGPDEDALFAEILGDASLDISFPPYARPEVRAMPAFRAQVRDLVTRAEELGLSPQHLHQLGTTRDEPMWVAAGQVLGHYEELAQMRDAASGGTQAPDRLDHAQLITAAASMLARWEEFVPQAQSTPGVIECPQWDSVIVDDVQNAPFSLVELLRVIGSRGASIWTAGDPDCAVQGFRGGIASLPGDLAKAEPHGIGAKIVYLTQRHRFGGDLAKSADYLTEHIRVGGSVAAHRNPEGSLETQIAGQRFSHPEEEAAGIAHRLREWHSVSGVSYSRMAILTRSRSSHSALRSSLIRREIPVENIGTDLPLRELPIVKGLLAIIELAAKVERTSEPAVLADVLQLPLIGIDSLELVKFGRILRGCELAKGGKRRVNELIDLVLESPEAVVELAPVGVEKLIGAAKVFERIRTVAATSQRQVEQVLWAAWDGCAKAEPWRALALGRGMRADAAAEALDSVIQLFRSAQRMADRDGSSTIDEFIRELELQDLPEDSIARAGGLFDAVTLATPASAQGREWDYVIIAGLQEGAWPDLRVRDTYTHTSRLTNIVTGREVPGLRSFDLNAIAHDEVLDDELRQIHFALTRARMHLLVTCVESDELIPSRFFGALGFESDAPESNEAQSKKLALGRPEVLGPEEGVLGLLAQIRALSGLPEYEEIGRQALAILSEAGFLEAESDFWLEGLEPSLNSATPQMVSVSPSRVEGLLACPLRGTLSMLGGERSDNRDAAQIGTLIHKVAEELPQGSAAELTAAFDRNWRAVQAAPEESALAKIAYDKGIEIIQTLAEYIAGKRECTETEKRVTAKLGEDTILRASIDRYSHNALGGFIADFKTSKVVPSVAAAEDNVQMQMYQWALKNQKEPETPGGAELVFIGKPLASGMPTIRAQGALTDEKEERARQRITNAAAIGRATNIPANPSEAQCRTCPFTFVCPAQPAGRLFS